MSRRFVAVGVPPAVREALQDALGDAGGGLDGLRLTEPDGWHITLAFLGEVPDGDMPHVVDAVRSAVDEAGTARRLALSGAGSFGDSVLWCAVTDEPEGMLARCADAVQRACIDRGLDVERRPLRPHVTIARRRARRRVTEDDRQLLDAVLARLPPARREWSPGSVDVLRSILGDGPARYTREEVVDASD